MIPSVIYPPNASFDKYMKEARLLVRQQPFCPMRFARHLAFAVPTMTVAFSALFLLYCRGLLQKCTDFGQIGHNCRYYYCYCAPWLSKDGVRCRESDDA